MAIELIKENIEYDQLLGEDYCDTVVKQDYLVPDTHPDIMEILMVDAKPYIVSKEVMQGKVYLEGRIDYNIIYLGRDEEKNMVCSIKYADDFSNHIEVKGAERDMMCEAECYVEHMDCNIVNDRKVQMKGIIKLKAEVYNKYQYEIVKNLDDYEEVQLLKKPASIDKIVGPVSIDLIGKCHIQIDTDKPEIDEILKCHINIHKKEVQLFDGKISVEAFAHIGVLYRGKGNKEICYIDDDVLMTKELDYENAASYMDNYTDFQVDAMEYDVKEDDLGENRILDIEVLVKALAMMMYREDMEMIEDAYSPNMLLDIEKNKYLLNVMQGHVVQQTIVKENIDIPSELVNPNKILMCTGSVSITEKKVLEDKVNIDGILNVKIMYKTLDEEKYIGTLCEELPFSCSVDIEGSKIDMQCVAKATLENIEAAIEAHTFSVKAVIQLFIRVNYVEEKEFILDIVPNEEEIPKKKASLTIYVVQAGDTLWKIAKKYYTTVELLANINAIENLDMINVGQKLIIPGRAVI